jgi:CheY-like chemotaxis protein
MRTTTVAWIDDDSYALYALVEPLIEMGINVPIYESYTSVLDDIENVLASDLILLDMILPPGKKLPEDEEDSQIYWGAKLLSRLRNEHGYRKPIIAFSIVGNAKDVISDNELANLDVTLLTKYCEPDQLREHVMAALILASEPQE